MTSPDFERLAALVQARRTELRLGIEPAAKAGGISKDTWKRVEAGQKVWDRSFAGIETALHWGAGSCVRILEGGDPQLTGTSPAAVLKVTKLDPQDFEQAFVSAMVVTKGDLTGNEIRELSDRVIDELKRRGVL